MVKSHVSFLTIVCIYLRRTKYLTTKKNRMQRGILAVEELHGGHSPAPLYTDTDSMFVLGSSITPRWEKFYYDKYKEEPIGDNLGQLSSDIDIPDEISKSAIGEPHIVAGYWLAKKVYLAICLTPFRENDKIRHLLSYTVRMKGVSYEAILEAAEKLGSVEAVYKLLSTGKPYKFNLCAGTKKRLQLDNRSQRYHLIDSFTRTVRIKNANS